MNAMERFDCAQILVLPGEMEALHVETAVDLIRKKQFWHVFLSGKQASACAKVLREVPGMPNFIVDEPGSAQVYPGCHRLANHVHAAR